MTEKSVLEMTDVEILEHVRGLVKKREEQTVEKAVKKIKEKEVNTTKKKIRSHVDPASLALLDFFNEEKQK